MQVAVRDYSPRETLSMSCKSCLACLTYKHSHTHKAWLVSSTMHSVVGLLHLWSEITVTSAPDCSTSSQAALRSPLNRGGDGQVGVWMRGRRCEEEGRESTSLPPWLTFLEGGAEKKNPMVTQLILSYAFLISLTAGWAECGLEGLTVGQVESGCEMGMSAQWVTTKATNMQSSGKYEIRYSLFQDICVFLFSFLSCLKLIKVRLGWLWESWPQELCGGGRSLVAQM